MLARNHRAAPDVTFGVVDSSSRPVTILTCPAYQVAEAMIEAPHERRDSFHKQVVIDAIVCKEDGHAALLPGLTLLVIQP